MQGRRLLYVAGTINHVLTSPCVIFRPCITTTEGLGRQIGQEEHKLDLAGHWGWGQRCQYDPSCARRSRNFWRRRSPSRSRFRCRYFTVPIPEEVTARPRRLELPAAFQVDPL